MFVNYIIHLLTGMNDIQVQDQQAFIIGLVGLMLGGLGVIAINVQTGSRTKRVQKTIASALWNFTPVKDINVQLKDYAWSWWKLFFSGVMLSSLSFTMTVKYFHVQFSLTVAVTLFIGWVTFLIIFWYWSVVPSLGDDSPAASKGASPQDDPKLPVTIVTGFLGAGKTTLVKNILSNTDDLKVLVIENEIGEEGVDHQLLVQHTAAENIILMNNGCICCTVRKDMIEAFHELFKQPSFGDVNWVVIETTGLADPAPLIQSLYMDPLCKKLLRLDSVVTVTDCKHLPLHLTHASEGVKGAHGGIPEAVQQLAYADRILLNKKDLISTDQLEEVAGKIREINSTAQMFFTENSAIPMENLFNVRSFDVYANPKLLLTDDASTDAVAATPAPMMIQVDRSGKLKKQRVAIGSDGKAQKIGSKKKSATAQIETISLTTSLPLDFDMFNMWMVELLQDQGQNIYRLKGILNMKDYDEQFVIQGVHMVFDGQKGRPWPTEPNAQRKSVLVFIGIKLDAGQLDRNFHKCVAKLAKDGKVE